MTNQNIYRLSTSAAAAALLLAFCAAPSHGQTARRGHRRAIAATTTTAAAAATDSSAPWRQFKLNPAARVKLDFRNATVDAVLRVLSQASGIPIVKDPSLTGTLTLESPRQQTLSDAFSLLSVALDLRNYEIDKQDKFLVVRQKPAAPATPSFPGGFNPAAFAAAGGGGGGSSRNQPDLVVYPIKYASASELATVINDVFATSSTTGTNNANPFAAAIAAATQNNGGNNNGGGSGGRGFGRRGGLGGANSTATVKASADDYSNSLIVNAPDDIQDQVADLIQQIDKQTDQPQQIKVYKLVYANATDLQPTIQSVLSGTTPVGRSSTVTNTNNRNQQNQNQNRGGRFGGFFGFGGGNNNSSSSTANGTVAADERTNSLVVTASTTNLAQIDGIIQTLDRPANYESTTFVYVMKYGRADVVANLLNQSFGNRTTGGAVGGALSTTGLAQTTLGSTTSSGTTAGGLSSNNTRNTASNFQVTSSNGTQNTTTTETTGFNAAGQVVNIRNLAGQVLLVPNIDTNSIIVSAPPEDRQLVETLLQQLDQVPRQVMIETLVVEATLTKNEELGVDLGAITKVNPFNIPGSIVGSSPLGAAFQPTTTGSTTDASGLPQGAQATLTGRGYSAVLRAIQQDQKFNVLSTPRIFATNNATAEINVSESIPYISTTEETTAGFPINSYSFLDVGLILTVTPRILSNGKVIMDVTQTDNSLVGFNTADIPITNQREAETTVSVLDGNTVVLGGIIQNSETKTVNKVPLLGDIPVFGNLFRSSNASKTRTELLVFLTPHVISTDSDATDLRKNTEQELGASTQQLIPKSGPTDAGASNQK